MHSAFRDTGNFEMTGVGFMDLVNDFIKNAMILCVRWGRGVGALVPFAFFRSWVKAKLFVTIVFMFSHFFLILSRKAFRL